MASMLQTFSQLDTDRQGRQALAGGKGAVLARLRQAGYPVPDGFALLPAAFEGDELRPEARPLLHDYLERLAGGDPSASFAVRSSALGEDAEGASFAGAFETVLDARSGEAVEEAVHQVRRSRHARRVQAYQEAMATAAGEQAPLEMAVVVQRLVQAAFAGVLFTADPVSGSRMHMSGNYVRGSGEALVSGQAEPFTFTLARPNGKYEGPPELKPFARKLYKLAARLEQELGGPQDIEWAITARRGLFSGPRLWLLQSRPITTLQGFNPLTGEWNDSLTGDYLWSSTNIGEAMPCVMTPYTWSVIGNVYNQMAVVPDYAPAGNICGRAYNNSSVMLGAMQALGQDVNALSQEMGGVRDEYMANMDAIVLPIPRTSALAILRNGIKLRRKIRQAGADLDRFLAENPPWCRAMHRRIGEAQSREDLLALWDEIHGFTSQGFWPMVAAAWRYAERAADLRADLVKLVGAEDADALLSSVSSRLGLAGPSLGPAGPSLGPVGASLLSSLGPVVGLSLVARGEMGREEYLEQWGHRGPYETEFSAPRPAEDPNWLDEQLAAYARAPVDAGQLLARQQAAHEAAWQRFQARYPGQARGIERRLDEAAAIIHAREAVRSEVVRSVWTGRAWALRAGEVTDLGDGVFFLTPDELMSLLRGEPAPVHTIPARRQTYERYKSMPVLPLVIRGRFDLEQWLADPNRSSHYYDAHGLMDTLVMDKEEGGPILGMPGSAGRAEGVVRRLDDVEEGDRLQPGEVLVANQTNIGWTLLFPRAAAIVTDVGAPLSHAAIVARELGIPAVVNCGDATARLHTGDRVRVDGAAGIVEVLAPAPASP